MGGWQAGPAPCKDGGDRSGVGSARGRPRPLVKLPVEGTVYIFAFYYIECGLQTKSTEVMPKLPAMLVLQDGLRQPLQFQGCGTRGRQASVAECLPHGDTSKCLNGEL